MQTDPLAVLEQRLSAMETRQREMEDAVINQTGIIGRDIGKLQTEGADLRHRIMLALGAQDQNNKTFVSMFTTLRDATEERFESAEEDIESIEEDVELLQGAQENQALINSHDFDRICEFEDYLNVKRTPYWHWNGADFETRYALTVKGPNASEVTFTTTNAGCNHTPSVGLDKTVVASVSVPSVFLFEL